MLSLFIIDRSKRRLRDPLQIEEKVLVLADRFRKKDTSGRLYISTIENKSFLKRDRTYRISERSKPNDNTYLFFNRFFRQELFALKNQFVE